MRASSGAGLKVEARVKGERSSSCGPEEAWQEKLRWIANIRSLCPKAGEPVRRSQSGMSTLESRWAREWLVTQHPASLRPRHHRRLRQALPSSFEEEAAQVLRQ